jgi:DNA-binding response OmpR family regulator
MAHILVVDDEPTVGELIAGAFEKKGHTVTVVHNGLQALGELGATFYDLMVLDLKMPVLDGVGVLKKRDMFPETKVVVLTGHSSEEAAVNAVNSNVSGYYRKPLTAAEIFALMETHLTRCVLGSFVIDLNTEAAYYNGALLPLSTGLFDIFSIFVRWPDRTLSYMDIAERLVRTEAGREKYPELYQLVSQGDEAREPITEYLKSQVSRLKFELKNAVGDDVLYSRRRSGFWWNPRLIKKI